MLFTVTARLPITLLDNPLVCEATELIRNVESDLLCNHSLPGFAFAVLRTLHPHPHLQVLRPRGTWQPRRG